MSVENDSEPGDGVAQRTSARLQQVATSLSMATRFEDVVQVSVEQMSSALDASARRRVLVVDDNVDAAEMLAETLRMVGFEVQVALDGPSALERAAPFAPDLVCLDIGLPGIDGFEVARRLRELGGRAPKLIAITGYGQRDDRARSLAAGFDRHMVKPVDLDALMRACAELTASAR